MSNERNDGRESEHTLRQLFAHARPRPVPPQDDTEAIRSAVFAEWEAVTARRQWSRRAAFGVAATVLLAVGLWVGGGLVPSATPVSVARVERVLGEIAVGGGPVGSSVLVGGTLSTGAGQIALRLARGGSLRIGPQSEVVLSSEHSAQLVAGVLYFDSEGRRADPEFTVTTELGVVRDVGTQFVVRIDAEQSALDVGVRDGRIVLTRDGASGTAGVGERLVAAADVTAIRRETMATFGDEWSWAEQLAPPFEIDGRSVEDFLAWFAEQTGRDIVFGSPEAERLARATILRGSIDLEPLQKLSAVFALTDLRYELEDARVVIDVR
jgi:ferric-dicitrate binding protein FerR (iron transport regulator)